MSEKLKSIRLGRITLVYGLKGWVKVYSWTDPPKNIVSYSKWQLTLSDGSKRFVTLTAGRLHGKTVIAKIEGCNDRDAALVLKGAYINVGASVLPDLERGEYYWYQLEGLLVYSKDQVTGKTLLLGELSHMMATGSNDVMVVRPTANSLDSRERLIPYLPDQFIESISLTEQRMVVNWPLDF